MFHFLVLLSKVQSQEAKEDSAYGMAFYYVVMIVVFTGMDVKDLILIGLVFHK